MFSEVMAEEGPDPAAPKPVGMMDMMLPLGLMFIVFYFLLIRPNQKKMKARDEFIKALKKGDEVITNGGVLGRVCGVTDFYVTLEIADNVKIKVLKNQVGFSAKDVQQKSKTEKSE